MTKIWFTVAMCTLFSMSFGLDPSYAARDKNGVLKASSLIGAKVQDTEGKKLGHIKDLVIDPLEGDIEYAVLDFGGFLGLGDKYFAVPWDAMKLGENQKFLILDVSKKVLKNAPGFPKDQWPDTSNGQWIITMYDFYDLPVPEDRKAVPRKPTTGAQTK